MKLHILRELIAVYHKEILVDNNWGGSVYWENVQNFQNHWDLDADDFLAMYRKCFKSSLSTNLWNKFNYEPHKAMEVLIQLDKDFIRSMFLDLFDENREIGGRFNRFEYHLNLISDEYRDKHLKWRGHQHDVYMISVYLSFRFPDRYCPIEYENLKKLLIKVESKNIPFEQQVDRSTSIVRNTLFKFLSQEEGIADFVRANTNSTKFYQYDCMMLCFDFYHSLAEKKYY